MKKYILILTMAFSLSSCQDFLKENMVSTITQDYFDTEQGLEQLIVGTYRVLRLQFEYFEEGPDMFDLGTDLTLKSNAVDMYNPASWSPTGDMGQGVNKLMGRDSKGNLGAYPIINNCNRAIEAIRDGKAQGIFATDPAYANLRLSEALFNRAWGYHLLVTQLGDVHMVLKSNNSLPGAFNFPKATSEQVYKQMIDDVEEALRYLPEASSTDRGRITKGAARHFLAKLYLERAQGAIYKSGYGRNADGSIDVNDPKAHLGMLYKGGVEADDLQKAIDYATAVIGDSYYDLADDYADLFAVGLNDYTYENNRENILQSTNAISYTGEGPNGRFGMRFQGYFATDYKQGLWGIPTNTWAYGSQNVRYRPTDWAMDVFTDRMADSRYEKTFGVEFKSARVLSESEKTDQDYYNYNDPKNTTQTWATAAAAYFNTNILPTYDRASWGGRNAVAGEHKIGKGDLGLVFLENTKATAITLEEAQAQPYVLWPRWIHDVANNEYYYRRNGTDNFTATNTGLEFTRSTITACKKHIDPNRTGLNAEYGSRDVAIFRLAETYLIRAEAYGRKDGVGSADAINDINKVRERAAYKPGETRAEVIARLFPGANTLQAAEKQWPYNVALDKTNDMKVDATYWDGASAKSVAENYPAVNTSGMADDMFRFVNFICNEYSREFNSEQNIYGHMHHAGIQADRILYHNQMASPLANLWDKADNVQGNQGQTGNGKGNFKPYHTFKPYPQTFMDMLTDANGTLLDAAAKKAYQNPGY